MRLAQSSGSVAVFANEPLDCENGDWFGGQRVMLDDDPTILSGADLLEVVAEGQSGQ